MRYPLRFKLLAAFFVVLLIPLLQVVLYGYTVTRHEWQEQVLRRAEHEVFLQAEQISAALAQVHGDALYLGQLNSLQRLLSHPSAITWRSEAERDLEALFSARPMYRHLRVLTSSGAPLVRLELDGSTAQSLPDSAPTADDSDLLRRLNSSPSSPIYIASFSGGAIIRYAMRLPQGNIAVIGLDAQWLLRHLPRDPQGNTWGLVDQRGHYLFHPEGAQIPRNRQLQADYAPLLSAGRGYFEASDQVVVYQTLYPSARSDQFWALYRATPSHLLYAEVNDFYTNSALLMVAGAFVAVALALFLGESISAPILRLQRQALRFGHEGALLPTPQAFPTDEIGALAEAFYAMAHELQAKRRQEKRLIERLIDAQEEERKRVAYDLHDGLIQQLVGARLYLSQCRHDDPQGEDNFQRGCAALSEAIVEGRRIIEGLRPGALDDLGLAEALRELASNQAQAADWTLHLSLDPHPLDDHLMAVTLYRIAQEALNNIRKHAQARAVHLSLWHDGEGWGLWIQDDGCGLEVASLRASRGLGITTMHERAEQLGGLCQIESAPGRGTSISVYLPTTFPSHSPSQLLEER